MAERRSSTRAARPPTGDRDLRAARAAETNGVFSKRLAQARKSAGLTQVDLAALLQRDRSLISHLERGQIGKMLALLRHMSQELGVSSDYLLGLTDSPVCSVCQMREVHDALHALLTQSDGKIERLNESIAELLARLPR